MAFCKSIFSSASVSAILLSSLLGAAPALADRGGHGHGHEKHSHEHDDDRYEGRVVISGRDRVVVREYIVEDYNSHCPPGLRKKHNGCRPPGHAKKHYVIGRPLPEVVVWEPVPQPLLMRLEPVPVGYQYVRVDNDVLMISEASHKVIDAITLLSAVGK